MVVRGGSERHAVLYIARGSGAARLSVKGPMAAEDFGRASADAFFGAYRAHPAGRPHELIVACKGWRSEADLDHVRRLAAGAGGKILELPDEGFDWGTYFRVAGSVGHEWICCLNTHSRPRAEGWLDSLVNAADAPGVGAAAATGSWGSIAPFPRPEPDLGQLALYPARLALFAMGTIRGLSEFPLYPNPHLRSNAFVIRRERLLEFAGGHRIPIEKRDTHRLESSRRGLTRYLASHGLGVVVAGADGRSYPPDRWVESATFRVPGQPNLLIEDNQTDFYTLADRFRRRRLERASWGRLFTP